MGIDHDVRTHANDRSDDPRHARPSPPKAWGHYGLRTNFTIAVSIVPAVSRGAFVAK